MFISRQENYQKMSEAAAEVILTLLKAHPDPLIMFATGYSPKGLYKQLAGHPAIINSKLRAIMLDEWHGIKNDHPGTCRHYGEKYIFEDWKIAKQNRFIFDASAPDPEAECKRMAQILQKEGPIDLCILGLGENGHLGLNEPGNYLIPSAHVAHLDSNSQTHTMLTNVNISVSKGLTFGMADLLGSKQILMLVSGSSKQEIATSFLKDKITTELPASFLHLHPHTTCIIDQSIFPS